MRDLSGRRVTVMGLGRFGGGLGVARWLAAQGADVLVTDLEPEERLQASVAALRPLADAGQVSLRLGEHNVSDFTTCDLVVANPAVLRPWENRFLRAATAAGIPITTEIELVVERLDRRRVIGVTGSMGKSTTAALIAHILRECGQPVMLGGNIGGSLLEETERRRGGVAEEPWVVLELSSAMLHWLHAWSPHVAVVTNIADNHKDWHGTFEHYAASKRMLLESQEPGDAAVLGRSVAEWPTRFGVQRVVIESDAGVGTLAIPGRHNRLNAALALAAIGALEIDGLDGAPVSAATEIFPGLPHRLQFVGDCDGVKFYNDSKATTPEATALALAALGEDRFGPGCEEAPHAHLIAGGYDKGTDLTPLAEQAPYVSGLYTVGATGASLAEMGRSQPSPRHVQECGTLDRAVGAALARARPGDVVLLSPGCASWDQFENYERRGERFVELVRALAERGARAGAR